MVDHEPMLAEGLKDHVIERDRGQDRAGFKQIVEPFHIALFDVIDILPLGHTVDDEPHIT